MFHRPNFMLSIYIEVHASLKAEKAKSLSLFKAKTLSVLEMLAKDVKESNPLDQP